MRIKYIYIYISTKEKHYNIKIYISIEDLGDA